MAVEHRPLTAAQRGWLLEPGERWHCLADIFLRGMQVTRAKSLSSDSSSHHAWEVLSCLPQ